MVNLTLLPTKQHQASLKICQPLVKLILEAECNITGAIAEQRLSKRRLYTCRRREPAAEAETRVSSLLYQLQRCARAAQENGVSSGLSAIPLEQHGFSLHKLGSLQRRHCASLWLATSALTTKLWQTVFSRPCIDLSMWKLCQPSSQSIARPYS